MTIIFSHSLRGHYLEYIHHIYDALLTKKEEKYVFVIPKEFEEVKSKLVWVPAEHIKIDLIEPNTAQALLNSKILKRSFIINRIIKSKIEQYGASKVLSTSIITLLPFAPFYISASVKVSGIIYMIYLYKWKTDNLLRKVSNVFKYLILSKFNCFDKILILNDEPSARKLNQLYHVTKFSSIVDPFFEIESKSTLNIREEYNIDQNKVIISQFGALNMNKGTLDVMESIVRLPHDLKNKICFIFAGRVHNEIRSSFDNYIDVIRKNNIQLIVEEGFQTYDYLTNLCKYSDAFVIPYKRTAQSSGVIGYASQFGKPVIAPAEGLLGKLVRRYNLGVLVSNTSPESLIEGYVRIIKNKFVRPDKTYCQKNSLKEFEKKILDAV